MKQEPKSIYDFKPGDIVTRIEPVVKINPMMFMGGIEYDGEYVGEKLVFIGIANGCAYFEATDAFTYLLEKGKPISLPIHKFENGWAHYIDPITIVNAMPRSKYDSMSDTALVCDLDSAIEKEEYEEASRIQHEINKREI
jgi:hypothetical protein